MSALSEFHERENLERAWKWLRSNPDPTYKRYCADQYSRFAIADDLLIDDLHDRLRRGIYEPRHACKIMMPKRSGILRPYTVLTVEDQLVYQGMANVIAERLAPKIRNRYFVQVFGNLYAGRASQWFYRRWRDGYTAFNKAARDAFNRGLVFGASFDLTACYDSLDHSVLCHFLGKLNCEQEFCDALRAYLSVWTATEKRIYQNHGIPQGPLSSGLISELVLQHFDQHHRASTNLVYLRYVDDIRLFAKKEADLRRILVRLDELSKDVGLFPQASKIDIHRVLDIEEELKSISNPTEVAVKGAMVNQKRLVSRIIALTPRLTPSVKIHNETRFKYLLAFASPTSRLNGRLLTISAARPDLVPNVARYFKRYARLPRKVAAELLKRIDAMDVYAHVTAHWLDVVCTRVSPTDRAKLNRMLKRNWKPRTLSPELKAAIGKALILEGKLTVNQTRYAIRRVLEGWVRSELVGAVNAKHYGTASLESFINDAIRDENPDVSLAGALQAATLAVRIHSPLATINPRGGKALRQLGVIRRVPGRNCGVEWSFQRLIGKPTGVNWHTIFGPTYRQAETQAVHMRALADTNVTAFVNAADVFNDLLLSRLYDHDASLGTYALGNIGSVLSSTRLRNAYPFIFRLCNSIHDERLKSHLSHPVVKTTGKPTSRIPYRFLRTAKRLYADAIAEVESTW